MISYQLFTQTAVVSVVESLNSAIPVVATWLSSRIDMIIFIYAFAWVFVLSSVIPSKILGGERSVIVQFLVCLTLTLSAFIILDLVKDSYGVAIDQILSFASLLNNPLLAALYLAAPYILMVGLDVRSRNKHMQEKQRVTNLTAKYLKDREKINQQRTETE